MPPKKLPPADKSPAKKSAVAAALAGDDGETLSFVELMSELKQFVSDEIAKATATLKADIQAGLKDVNASQKKLETAVTARLEHLEARVVAVEDRVDNMRRELDAHVAETRSFLSALGMRQLKQSNYHRKWSLTITGVKGDAGEDEAETRRKVQQLGTTKLNRGLARLSACHRLKHDKPNSAIYVRFTDLSERNAWLKAASGLRAEDRISLIPDIEPCLRDLRYNLLQVRKDKRKVNKTLKCHIRYHAEWPFVTLVCGEGATRTEVKPEEDPDEVVSIFLGLTERPDRPGKDD